MELKPILVFLVLCAVIITTECGKPCDYSNIPEYARVKRAKYYSSPQRFYRRPPITYPVQGMYSYTPPPMVDDEDSYPRGFQPSKFSQKPISETSGDDDINNYIKYLFQQDLDKMIEAANYKDKYNNNEQYENKLSAYKEENIYNQNKGVNIDQQFPTNGPHVTNLAQNSYEMEFNNRVNMRDVSPRIVNVNTQTNNADFDNAVINTEESMKNNHISFFNYKMPEDVNASPTSSSNIDTFSNPEIAPEELLPRPVNLRDEEDFDGSFTNNIPRIVRADPTSYKVENFGNLPLMNYNKHQQMVSSYQVPHYTVTTFPKSPSSLNSFQQLSSSSSSLSSPGNTPPLEPAPPISEAKQQSDAHLKATKIWTYRSKGTAYYLYPDGTLALRSKPYRP